jgi:hypothetical protein
MIGTLLVLGTWIASPAPAAPPGPRWESAPVVEKKLFPCAERGSAEPALDEALRALTFEVGGERRPFRALRLEGLTAAREAELWRLLGEPPPAGDPVRAVALVRRLARSGLFARVVPVMALESEGVTLTVRLTEHPRLTRVVFEGLTEARPEALLLALLELPRTDGKKCPGPPVPREWLARVEGDVVYPGLVWRGVPPAIQRVQERLFDSGYRMASLSAELAPDGTLSVRIDEGRLEAIEIRGVSPRLEGEVRRRLQIPAGAVFDSGELEGALGRVRAAFPFLDRDPRPQATRRVRVVEEAGEGGVRRYRVEPGERAEAREWFTVEGHRLVLHLRARRGEGELDLLEILRHTPVTGFAPGFRARGRLWDPEDRLHVSLEAAGNLNSYRARQGANVQMTPVPDPALRWRFDWMVGSKVEIPRVRVAELGAHVYSRVDTADRWRIAPIDSYIYSALFNRPESEYFHRSGVTAFVSTHLLERITVGVEYRRDEYVSLENPVKYWTLFNRDEPPFPNPPVVDGVMASLVLRFELATTPEPAHQVGAFFRDAERTIVKRGRRYFWSELRTLNTLEIADPGLGGDSFRFVKLVSDSSVFVIRTSRNRGLKVRFRAAGRLGGNLPAQKEEALGGWTALRGYGFKEFRGGDFSLLGTVEYRLSALSAFVDVGSVRVRSEFGSTRAGLGLALNLGDQAALTMAWRTDDEAELWPEVRFLFSRTY